MTQKQPDLLIKHKYFYYIWYCLWKRQFNYRGVTFLALKLSVKISNIETEEKNLRNIETEQECTLDQLYESDDKLKPTHQGLLCLLWESCKYAFLLQYLAQFQLFHYVIFQCIVIHIQIIINYIMNINPEYNYMLNIY